ncbi:MAG: MFS transporter [Endomicrobiales bacterium]|jgi:predicted MFS family arabinose efflux permease
MDSKRKPYRWTVLAVYTALAGVSQMLWLNFAPLISQIQHLYGVSEFMASSLVLSFPLLYIVLSLPAGAMIDRRGYKTAIGTGALLTLVFACARIYTGNFWILLAAQVGIACGQPFIMNGISKLVADWFDDKETATAMGLGTVGMFIGMALGMAVTPIMVADRGLQGTMTLFAVITAVSVAAFFFFTKENEPSQASTGNSNVLGDSRAILLDKDLVLLFIVSFLGIGFFNGLTTWLEPILAPNGISAETAGLIGAFLIIGGIIGSCLIPILSDKLGKRKPFLMFCIFSALVFVYPLCTNAHVTQLIILSSLVGFFMLPAYALMLTMAEELSGPQRAGTTTGILLLAGNAGAVVVIIAMEMVKGNASTWKNALFLMMAILLVALAMSSYIAETFRKKNGETESHEREIEETIPEATILE